MSTRPNTLGPAERQTLLLALDVRGPALGVRAEPVDWRALIAVSREARVLPALASRLLGARLTLPEETQAELRECVEETAARKMLLLAELARLSSLLAARGIEHVALKGAVLMARIYPSHALRHTVDLDVLVDPARFADALEVLRESGYREPAYTQSMSFDGRRWARALGAPHLHAAMPLQSPGGVVIDLHRRVPTTSFEASGGFAGWYARAWPVPIHGVSVPTAGDDDLTRHLCEHFALQNYGDPLDAPRLLCDLRALFAAEPPWQHLGERGSLRARAALGVVRALYEAAFHASASPRAHVRQLQRVAIADPDVTPWLAELSTVRSCAARFAADLVHRPRFAAAKFLPAPAYMVERYGVDPSSPRLYVQYARRLAAVVARPLRQRA